jgi:hypothetical protein
MLHLRESLRVRLNESMLRLKEVMLRCIFVLQAELETPELPIRMRKLVDII